MKNLSYIFLFLLAFTCASAQFTGIDASGYPTIRAYGTGPIFNNAKVTDFTVLENGQNMSTTANVQCSTVVKDPSISVVLAIDISESMNESVGAGLKRIDWVKQGAKTFVQSLTFNAQTRVAVITFDGYAYLNCGFQSSPGPVLAAIDNITVSGGATQYDPALLDPKNGAIALLKTTPNWIRRMIVFLTDGLPNKTPSVQAIINQLQAEKITLHALYVANQLSTELGSIAVGSGGQIFKANTQELINSVYRQLAQDAPQTVKYCWLEWQSPPVCTEAARNRTVQLTHKPTNIRQTYNYVAPPRAIAGISLSTNILPPFPDIPPNSSATQTYIITALNLPILVTNAIISPQGNFTISDWGGTPPPFTLAPGASRTLTVKFSQTAPRDVRTAQITIQGAPCSSPPLYVTGGATKVSVITPNGGEIYSTCDSISVQWSGVDPTDRVVLHYRNNGSLLWELLVDGATGLKYIWNNPPALTQAKVRVAAKTPRTDYSQPIAISGNGNDSVTSVAVHSSGSLMYLTGKFDKNAIVGFPPNKSTGPATITTPRNEEAFVAQASFGGIRWAVSGASFLQPFAPFTLSRGMAIALNEQNGEAWSTGEFFRQTTGKHTLWIAAFKTDGSTRWVKEYDSYADLHVRRIGLDDSTKKMFIEGYYVGDFTYTLVSGKIVRLSSATAKPYLALLDDLGRIVHLQDGSYIKPSPQVRDSIGNRYEFGAFRSNPLVSADTTLLAKGAADGYVRKFGRVLSPSDESDADFSVQQPAITFKQSNISIGASNVGVPKSMTFEALLCNTRKVPALINSLTFMGGDSTDFELLSPVLPLNLEPDSCVQVILRFTPPRTGMISTRLVAKGGCVGASIGVEGLGTVQSVKIVGKDWGSKRALTDNVGEVYIENSGTTPITVTSLSLKSLPESAFIPVFPQTPYILQPGRKDTIPVQFNPRDTLQYSNYVTATFAELADPEYGILQGSGFLPKLTPTGFEFGLVDVGTIAPVSGKIYLNNPSTTSPTAIKKIEVISNSGDFTFSTMPPRFQVDELQMDSSSLTITFKPKSRGRRLAVVKIYSDAAPGPEIDPTVDDTVHIVGYGVQVSLLTLTPVDFGIVSSCDQPTDNIVVSNPDPLLQSKISNVEIIGNDKDYFVLLPHDSIIPANGSITIPVRFLPNGKRMFSAMLRLYDNYGQEYTVDIRGESAMTVVKYEILPTSIIYTPGKDIQMRVVASSQAQKMPEITTVRLALKANQEVISYGSITQSSSAWTWTSAEISDAFTCTGIPSATNTMPLGEIAAFNFLTFLGDEKNMPVTLEVTTDSPCITPETSGSVLILDQLCFKGARFVRGGKQYYLRAVFPQPTTDQISVPLGVGLTGNVSLKIVDQLGRTAAEIVNGTLQEGEYEFSIPTTGLSAGVYSLVYTAGKYSAVQTVVIQK